MVDVFFVVSGYALSYKPLSLARSKEFTKLNASITSSFFSQRNQTLSACGIHHFRQRCSHLQQDPSIPTSPCSEELLSSDPLLAQ